MTLPSPRSYRAPAGIEPATPLETDLRGDLLPGRGLSTRSCAVLRGVEDRVTVLVQHGLDVVATVAGCPVGRLHRILTFAVLGRLRFLHDDPPNSQRANPPTNPMTS